jgi:pyruvate carboxylase
LTIHACAASVVLTRHLALLLFESNMRYCSSDVYQHEMPGGQYTNLKFQAASLGLGDSWGKVQQSYAAANRALGDIVKVRKNM